LPDLRLSPFQQRHCLPLPQPNCPTLPSQLHLPRFHPFFGQPQQLRCLRYLLLLCSFLPSKPQPSSLLSKPSMIIVIKPTLLHAHHHQQTYCLHKTPPHPLLSLSLHNFSTVFYRPIPPTIGTMALTLLTRSITTNPQTSALHGATSSTLGNSQHFPTFKLPSSKPSSKPLLLATQLIALYLSGGYCFTLTCLSLHHLQKNNATTFPLAIPSVTT
jgi:hypothetical protein